MGEGYLLGSDGSERSPSSSFLSATSCAIWCAAVGGSLCVRVCQAGDADYLSPLPSQFCGAIVLIFFLELAVAVLAFLFQDWVRDRFREFFESNIRSYRDDIDLQNLIDSLQKAVSSAPDRLPARACPFPPLLSLGCPTAEMEQGLPSSEWLFCHSMAWKYGACPRPLVSLSVLSCWRGCSGSL